MTLLWIIDCIAISFAVAFIVCGCWLAVCLILLAVHGLFRHNFEVNKRLMDRFSQTTNYPMYQLYQERAITAAHRAQRVENILGYMTFN